MKKSLASLSIVSLLATGVLASCGEGYTYKEGVMLSLNGKDYTVNEIFDHYGLDTQAGVKAYYDAINNVAIEATVKTTEEMKKKASTSVQEFKDQAESTAKQNGTSYDEELEKALEEKGVEDLDELTNKYLLDQKIKKRESDYYTDDKYKELTPKFVAEENPYHVKHILVKVDASGNSVGTISESNAKKLHTVVSSLANENETFGSVAYVNSDDGSKSDYGHLEVVTKKTGFVNEFKYGLYTYDALFNEKVANKDEVIEKTFGANAAEYKELNKNAFGIPYSAVLGLNKYANKTTDNHNLTVEGSVEGYYPRNVLFNNYFNHHGLSFIYLDTASESLFDTAADGTKWKSIPSISDHLVNYSETTNGSYKHQTAITPVEAGKKILCDEKGNPILVTRAGTGTGEEGYQGVHFIVIDKSPFEGNVKVTDEETKAQQQAHIEEVSKYYTIDRKVEFDAEDPTTWTYVNSIEGKRTDMDNRIQGLKNKIVECDSNINLTMFEETLASAKALGLTLDADIEKALTRYIDTTRTTTLESEVRTYDEAWETYYNQLKVANDFSKTKVLPLSAYEAFLEGTDAVKTYIGERAGK